jgi:hypothetical protein
MAQFSTVSSHLMAKDLQRLTAMDILLYMDLVPASHIKRFVSMFSVTVSSPIFVVVLQEIS